MDTTKQNEYNISNMDFSKLHPYSLGVVVKGLDVNEDGVTINEEGKISDIIEVYPIEKVTDTEAKLTDKEKEIKVDVIDNCGNKEKIVIKKSNTIIAKWLSLNQYNRVTPPTIRKGEYVILYRVSNADIFYWDTVFNDPRIRKEEVVIYTFSDKPKINLEEKLEEMYYLKIDTKNKLVTFHTTDKYGEACKYDIKLDTKDGTLSIIDGLLNSIVLHSVLGSLTVKTNTNVNIFSPTVTVQSVLTSVISKHVDVKSETTSVTGSSEVDVNGGKITIKGSKVDINP